MCLWFRSGVCRAGLGSHLEPGWATPPGLPTQLGPSAPLSTKGAWLESRCELRAVGPGPRWGSVGWAGAHSVLTQWSQSFCSCLQAGKLGKLSPLAPRNRMR